MLVNYQKSFLIEMLARNKKITYICLVVSTLRDKDGRQEWLTSTPRPPAIGKVGSTANLQGPRSDVDVKGQKKTSEGP